MSVDPAEGVYCRNAKWSDVLIFFLANIIAHAATVPSSPGNTIKDNIEMALFSLILPFYGVGRALSIIKRCAILGDDPLQKASRAGALCAIGRTWDLKVEGDGSLSARSYDGKMEFLRILSTERFGWGFIHLFLKAHFRGLNPKNVHGQRYLTENYAIYTLGRFKVEEFRANIDPNRPGDNDDLQQQFKLELTCNHSFVKPAISAIQIFYASIALYRNRGDQVTYYGIGAYSFIVIPYILMSFVNLVAAFCCPEYSCFYLVESDLMEEAKTQGCHFNGAVGRLKELPQAPLGRGSAAQNGSEVVPVTSLWEWVKRKYFDEDYYEIRNATLGRLDPQKRVFNEKLSQAVAWALAFVVITGPFIIVGVLSRFGARQSTFPQRGWLLVWIPFNFISMMVGAFSVINRRGVVMDMLEGFYQIRSKSPVTSAVSIFTILVLFSALAAPTFWVFWVTGKSIMEYKVCEVV